MLKLKLEKEEDRITHVELRGDFFLEPAEKLSDIENCLKGLSVEASVEDISERLRRVEVKMIGFSPEDVGKSFRKAVGGKDE